MTPIAHAVRFAMRCGITSPAELARELECTPSAVYRAMKQLEAADRTVTPSDPTVKSDPTVSSVRSQTDRTVTKSDPTVTRARVEYNNSTTLVVEPPESPLPPNVKPVASWNHAFGGDDHGVEFTNGKLTLVNGTRTEWLALFDNDAVSLDLALREAAGEVQPNSRTGLRLQVERLLARKVRDKRDRDARYDRAVKANAKSPGTSKSTADAMREIRAIAGGAP